MPLRQYSRQTLRRLKTSLLLLQVAILSGFTIVPLFAQHAFAANPTIQLAPRRAFYPQPGGTSEPGATTDITFAFQLSADGTHTIKAVLIEFCDTPLGSCTTVNTPDLSGASYTDGSDKSGWDDNTAFSYALGNGHDVFNDGAASAGNSYQNLATFTRAGATNPETTINSDKTITIEDIVNNNTGCASNSGGKNCAFYARITLYTDDQVPTSFGAPATAWVNANLWYYGTVAQATATTLIVNARVQEHLDFCVGVTPVDDTSTSPATSGGTNKDCRDVSGDTVDIGTITPTAIAVSPVPSTDGGNTVNGVAMVASNASNGTVISFFSQQDSDGGANGGHGLLKVVGAQCDASGFLTGVTGGVGVGSTTDKCFNDFTNDDSTAAVAGREEFGMTIGSLNIGNVNNAYPGNGNLVPNTAYYDGTGCTGGTGTSTCSHFAWNDTDTAHDLASSASSTTKVLNYEALILKFAATAAVTTPTGQYTTASTYIATSTF